MNYKVGDTVWVATFESREQKVPCPVCCGKMRVTVILGNDEHVKVDCDFCSRGFDGPRGYITEYVRIPRVEQTTITLRVVKERIGGEEFVCYVGDRRLHIDNIFETEAEALTDAQKQADDYNAEQLSNPKFLKINTAKNYTWNAGYHTREAKKCREEAERHEQKAQVCKERSKE